MKMRLWIARDKDDAEVLWLFDHRPMLSAYGNYISNPPYRGPVGKLLANLFPIFPSLTWENSPQQVELKLIGENKD